MKKSIITLLLIISTSQVNAANVPDYKTYATFNYCIDSFNNYGFTNKATALKLARTAYRWGIDNGKGNTKESKTIAAYAKSHPKRESLEMCMSVLALLTGDNF